MYNLDLSQTQRYYHFVCLKGNKSIIKKTFFSSWNIKEKNRLKIDNGCILYNYSMISNYQYYKGEVDNSLNRNNKPPYVFDIILLDYSSIDITILGFPYKKMTIDLITSLIQDHKILVNSNFLKINMDNLIHAYDKHTDIYHNENHLFLGGVFLSITGNSFLSTVKLIGDKPLDSEIYINYFKKNLLSKKSHLDKCILKCKTNLKTNSSLHIDKFGNYKLYVQNMGKSLLTLPSIFEFLHSIESFIETPNNPVYHILEEE
ncbi:MAG TPA: hypothetical protein PK622_12760 [Saprospiraceae bacterium]|nr:hypothetical protein [Saprospiraceae bacterium]